MLLEGNTELNKTISEFLKPLVTRTTIENDGYGNAPLFTPSSSLQFPTNHFGIMQN